MPGPVENSVHVNEVVAEAPASKTAPSSGAAIATVGGGTSKLSVSDAGTPRAAVAKVAPAGPKLDPAPPPMARPRSPPAAPPPSLKQRPGPPAPPPFAPPGPPSRFPDMHVRSRPATGPPTSTCLLRRRDRSRVARRGRPEYASAMVATGQRALAPGLDEAAARRSLRAQIAHLERRLAMLDLAPRETDAEPRRPRRAGVPRLMTLGELERARDRLAVAVETACAAQAECGARQEQARVRLERMLLDPGRHRFERVRAADLGEGGCGVYAVRPRLGLVGMLMGWWQVKLSSGCPLAG